MSPHIAVIHAFVCALFELEQVHVGVDSVVSMLNYILGCILLMVSTFHALIFCVHSYLIHLLV